MSLRLNLQATSINSFIDFELDWIVVGAMCAPYSMLATLAGR